MVSIDYPFIILFDIICYTLCNDGVCYTKIQGSPESFCCDNFEMRERMCVECRPGYTSSNNKSCLPCPAHYYGKRCAERCACTEAERCDHVKGCVNGSSPVNNTTDIFFEDTSTQPSLKTTENKEPNDTYIQPSLKTTENRKDSDPSLHPISIYSISAASLTFMLVIGLILMVYNRRHTGIRRQKRDTKEQNLQQIGQTVER